MDFKNTSDFLSGFWSIYVSIIALVSIIGCGVFLWVQSSAKISTGKTTGHVWDENLEEYNNPMPNWWRWLFYLTIFFSLGYLALYPGLGTFQGSRDWTMRGQYEEEMAKAEAVYGPKYSQFLKQDVPMLAANTEAREMGHRLFLTYCAQCHGSDARGARGFPNLTDSDWLWGGTGAQITESIAKGRNGMMPAKGFKPDLNGDQIKDLANYVRSLSGLSADTGRAVRGKELFAQACLACHGPEGKGTIGLAPNLTDKVWLYSSSEEAIIETITKGRQNQMPAFGDFLGEAKVHLLAAYVYGQGGGVKDAVPAVAGETTATEAAVK